jgi:hypothetical protein
MKKGPRMLGNALRAWISRMADNPEKQQSASCRDRHLVMMGAHDVVAQFADLLRTIGGHVSDPARLIELELTLALARDPDGRMLSSEDRAGLVRLRNELVNWNRWSTARSGEVVDLAAVLDEGCLGVTGQAVVLMVYTGEDMDYWLIAERVDGKIVVSRLPMPGEENDPSAKVEYEDLSEREFAELWEEVHLQNDTSGGNDRRDLRFGSYEGLLGALHWAAYARHMWDQRSSAKTDGQNWPMYGPKS